MFRFKKHGASASGREKTSTAFQRIADGGHSFAVRPRPDALDELNARLNLYPMPRNVVRMPQTNVDLLERARAFRGKRG